MIGREQGGFTAIANFAGTTSGNVPLTINGGNFQTISYAPGSLPTGLITVQNSDQLSQPTFIPLCYRGSGNPTLISSEKFGDASAALAR